MWVIKIGGSLQHSENLPGFLAMLVAHAAGTAIIVPGGGVFADQVRALQNHAGLDDVTAHRMALRAMEQFGTFLVSYEPALHPARSLDEISDLLARKKIPVWFPFNMLADNPSIRPSWDVTSDSLALWLAEQLHCGHLFMLKSANPATDNYSAPYLSQQGLLDRAYIEVLRSSSVLSWWLNYQQAESFFHMLARREHPATVMHEITVSNQHPGRQPCRY